MPAHGSLNKQDVLLATTRQEELVSSVQLPSACAGVTQVQQQNIRQEFQANFGTAIR